MTTTFTDAEFTYISDMVRTRSAIVLEPGKEYLVEARLAPLVRELGLESIGALVTKLRQGGGGTLADRVTEAMTTNETSFFRDVAPFQALRTSVLASVIEARKLQRSLRIWCAASSSGQEPYSISMAVEEYRQASLGVLKQPVEIVATDLSRSMLDACKRAEYDQLSLSRGLSRERLQRFFEPLGGDRWQVKSEVRQRVRFQALNLLDTYLALGRFDIVFCRNVLIYFSAEVKKDILTRIHATLRPGGYLFLGASEALNGLPDLYQMVQCSPGIIYKVK